MNRLRWIGITLSLSACLGATIATPARAGAVSGTLAGGEIGWYKAGASVPLSNDADYAWWYGCSATSAGMMMGYYDRNGYEGADYSNLVPGGVAEASTFGGGTYLVNSTIASAGHIADFYKTPPGYNGSGDDNSEPWHDFDCLADYMGTNQDAAGNSNGSTTFYYFTEGDPLTAADALAYGISDNDGMYGLGEYVEYAGYSYDTLFTQLIDAQASAGFTFEQYMAEIDAGRPVLVHVEGHTMLGYGYDQDSGNHVHVHDTWSLGDHVFAWGGSYSGMVQWGVTVLSISGGSLLAGVPEPSTAVLSILGLLGLAFLGRSRSRAS